jgi:hypothetical protein
VTDQPEQRDDELIRLFVSRDQLLTAVVLRDGRLMRVFNIAWGYDMSDEYAHVTTNISPGVPGAPIDFFFTNEVATVFDDMGQVLVRL